MGNIRKEIHTSEITKEHTSKVGAITVDMKGCGMYVEEPVGSTQL